MSPKTHSTATRTELMERLNSACWAVRLGRWNTGMASEDVSSMGMQGLHMYIEVGQGVYCNVRPVGREVPTSSAS